MDVLLVSSECLKMPTFHQDLFPKLLSEVKLSFSFLSIIYLIPVSLHSPLEALHEYKM